MDKTIAAWEDDGGSPAPFSGRRMIGTLNQIAWALQIKSRVEAEFERLRAVLEHAIRKQSAKDLRDIEAIIRILEDKRAEVLENEQAGYFIHNWQELGNQVSRMVVEDPRYQAIRVNQAARLGIADPH